MKDFPLLYPGGFLLPPGAYNHRLNLGNIDGVNFWGQVFTAGTDLMEVACLPIVTNSVAIAT